MEKPQSYENHAKIVPAYHVVGFAIVAINLLWSVWLLIKQPSIESVLALLMAIAFVIMLLYLRLFPLKVQDRLIRLEMRLRLTEILPEDLRARIGELSAGQLVALRFAGDDELPDLVRQVLDGQLEGRDAIKKSIKNWQADHLRC